MDQASKHLDVTEARLGVRLLHRTTRLTLTEAGRSYVDACVRLLAELEEAEQAAAAGQVEPRGLLRMNLPVSFGLGQVAPLLAAFSARHPLITLNLGFNDRLVDLVEEGWDLTVRVGTLRASTLVARRLAPCRMVVCAAPAYLATRGTPVRVADLPGHNCLGYTLSDRQGAHHWCFGPDGSVVTPISGTVRANNWLR